MVISSFLAAKAIVENPICLKLFLYQSICIKCHIDSVEVDMTDLMSTLFFYTVLLPTPVPFEQSWLRS